jgi:hypothetical protein
VPGDLDAEKLGALRQWASGLQADVRPEVSAAGKAILLLVDEIENLHVLLWDKQLYPDAMSAASNDPSPEGHVHDTPYQALRHRLLRRRRDDASQVDGFPGETFHSWIHSPAAAPHLSGLA